VPAYEIIHMVAVGHTFVPAGRAVSVSVMMGFAIVIGSAGIWIGAADGQRMFVDMLIMSVVQMAIMEIIGVSFMHNRLMPTF